jgi:hypothetical protein
MLCVRFTFIQPWQTLSDAMTFSITIESKITLRTIDLSLTLDISDGHSECCMFIVMLSFVATIIYLELGTTVRILFSS